MVRDHKITCTMLVPVMLYFLLDSPRATDGSMDSMETIFYGASPMSPARLTEGLEKWGQIFYQFFGQSECPMVIANMSKKDHDLSKPERLAVPSDSTVADLDHDPGELRARSTSRGMRFAVPVFPGRQFSLPPKSEVRHVPPSSPRRR